MALTSQQAAVIARRHRLSLQDAAGLLSLADDEDEAERIAAEFASAEGEVRRFTRALFAEPKAPTGVFGKGRSSGDAS